MTTHVALVGLGAAAGPLPGDGAPRYIVVYLVAESVKAGSEQAAR